MNEQDRDWIVKYFERMIADQDRRIEQALSASRAAVDKAESAQEKRLDLLNEFRAQSKDESDRYATRETTDQRFEVLNERIARMETLGARIVGGLIVLLAVGVANLVKIWTG